MDFATERDSTSRGTTITDPNIPRAASWNRPAPPTRVQRDAVDEYLNAIWLRRQALEAEITTAHDRTARPTAGRAGSNRSNAGGRAPGRHVRPTRCGAPAGPVRARADSRTRRHHRSHGVDAPAAPPNAPPIEQRSSIQRHRARDDAGARQFDTRTSTPPSDEASSKASPTITARLRHLQAVCAPVRPGFGDEFFGPPVVARAPTASRRCAVVESPANGRDLRPSTVEILRRRGCPDHLPVRRFIIGSKPSSTTRREADAAEAVRKHPAARVFDDDFEAFVMWATQSQAVGDYGANRKPAHRGTRRIGRLTLRGRSRRSGPRRSPRTARAEQTPVEGPLPRSSPRPNGRRAASPTLVLLRRRPHTPTTTRANRLTGRTTVVSWCAPSRPHLRHRGAARGVALSVAHPGSRTSGTRAAEVLGDDRTDPARPADRPRVWDGN